MSGVEGLAVGVGANRGHKVTKFERKAKQSRRTGVSGDGILAVALFDLC